MNIYKYIRQGSTRNHLTKCRVKLFIIYLEGPLGRATKFTWDLLSKYPGSLGQDPLQRQQKSKIIPSSWVSFERVCKME